MRAVTPLERWISDLDPDLLRHLLGQRTIAVALGATLCYVHAPRLSDEFVRATLGERESPDVFRVALRMADGVLLGECSRCLSAFGPCAHAAVLAVDIAYGAALRDALTLRTSPAEAAARAPEVRMAASLERSFEGALASWLGAPSDGNPVEIAASPCTEDDMYSGRAYGDRGGTGQEPSRARIVSIAVRRVGERKLLGPRDIVALRGLSPRDRRALAHTRDRGSHRKAVYASDVEASLAIEAMRAHGGIFAEGFKTLLDFRAPFVKPCIAMVPAADSGPTARFDLLSALWTADGGATTISFAESIFFAGPFPFVWTNDGAIYRVGRDVDLEYAGQLARSPRLHVPPGRLKDAGARLLRATRGRGVHVPRHEDFGLPPVETPRIVLRLRGEPLVVAGELVAVYSKREISLLDQPASHALGTDDGRDLEYEAEAQTLVEEAGLVQASDDDGGRSGMQIAISGEPAVTFWQSGLLALRSVTDPTPKPQNPNLNLNGKLYNN